MHKISVRCEKHQKPLKFIIQPQLTMICLECRDKDLRGMNNQLLDIDDYIDEVKQFCDTVKERYGNVQNNYCLKCGNQCRCASKKAEPEHEAIGKEQVKILEIVMKLLSQDKKKYHSHIEMSLAGHRKLWKQFDDTEKDIMYLNRLAKKNLFETFLRTQREIGWQRIKNVLKNISHRTFISNKIISQTKQIDQLLQQAAILKQQTVLRQLDNIITNHSQKKTNKAQSPQKRRHNNTNTSNSGKKRVTNQIHIYNNHKRSKSFNNVQ